MLYNISTPERNASSCGCIDAFKLFCALINTRLVLAAHSRFSNIVNSNYHTQQPADPTIFLNGVSFHPSHDL